MAVKKFGEEQINYCRRQPGFTIVETLVSLLIFTLLATAVIGSFAVLSSTTKAAREKTILSSLASQYLEIVRNMPYSQVGTLVGNPNGQLPDFTNAVTSQIGAYSYKIYYEVTYIDDPADGTILAGTDSAPNDYKQIKMFVKNSATGQITTFFTTVSPKGLEGINNAGALLIKVFNAQGQPVSNAAVHIQNLILSSNIILDRQADPSGQLVEVGLPASVNGYHIVVSKGGYTSDQTYPISGPNPNPTKPDATIVNGTVTQISFFIDIPSNLAIKTLDSTCHNLSGVNLNISGAALIGTTPNVVKYNQNFSSAGGQISLNNIEWDTYTPTLLTGQPWVTRGTSPVQKIDVLPNTSQTFTMILGTNSTPNSLLVIVKDAATGVALENATVNLSIPAPSVDPWYNASWGYRKPVDINHTKVSGGSNLSDFPVLFSVTDPDFKSAANGGKVGQGNGNDILFTLGDGTSKLDHELEYYDPATGQVVAWVRVPVLSFSVDTSLYLYFGNGGAASQQNKTGTWNGNFKGVWHLAEGDSTAAGFYKDATTNANNGTLTDANGNSSAITGKIDGAVNFNGDADYINAGSASVIDDLAQKTISFWTRRDVLLGTDDPLISKGGWNVQIRRNGGSGGPNRIRFSQKWSGSSGQTAIWRGSTQLNNTSSLYYVTVTYNGSSSSNDPVIYVNGVAETITSVEDPSGSLVVDAPDNFVIGADLAAGTEHDGILDEVHYYNGIRSADWIRTEYNNQSSPATFYSFGALEVPPSGPSGALASGITGGSVWLQNDWVGGWGQDNWSTTTVSRYFQDDGHIDVATAPTGVRLQKIGSNYQSPGWLESSTFDTGTASTNYTILSWQPTNQDPAATLKFQLATAVDIAGPWNYVGPDGTNATFYTAAGTSISASHDNKQYIRYKAFLSTTDALKTPVLTSVSINYVAGCFTPGQVWFGDLAADNYDLTVTLPGYMNKTISNINVNGNQGLEVLMNP